MAEPAHRTSLLLAVSGLILLVAGGAFGWLAARGGDNSQARFEQRVHDYLVAHPEVLAEAAENYRRGADQKQLAAIAARIEQPFPGAILGNPNGTVTLVEFTDFACTFCRASVAEVESLIAANPDLKVVIRELPIIAPTSPDAARWGLAAARQGKYPAFHKAMFAAGRTDMASIEAAARSAGMDLAQARTFAASQQASAELAANLDFGRKLGIDGTPTWVAGEQMITGAVGSEVLARAVEAARGRAKGS